MIIIFIILTITILIIATYTDLKTLEVPDWLNYAGITTGIGIHTLQAIQQTSITPIIQTLTGATICFAIACTMFYTGQWGGGDAKLLIAMGAIIGFQPKINSLLITFIVNLIIIGAIWGIIYSITLAIKNRKKFTKEYKKLIKEKTYKKIIITGTIFLIIFSITGLIYKTILIESLLFGTLMFFIAHLTIFTKATETTCMHKKITPDKLTEGDWLTQDIKIGNKTIKKTKLGLEKKQINELKKLYKQNKIKTISIKYGIPFVPSFLAGYITAIIFGNILIIIMQNIL